MPAQSGRPPRVVEIESLAQFDAAVSRAEDGDAGMRGWRVQSVDLTGRTDVLLRLDTAGAIFLGCGLTQRAETHLRSAGALVFPEIPDVPFDPYRAALYTPEELYAGLDQGYEATPDAQAYAWSRGHRRDVGRTLAAALHDHAIDDALQDHVGSHWAVGVMGGHAAARDSDEFRAAAVLGRALSRAGLLVATGGGPGAMEAANLGAFVAHGDDNLLDAALTRLAAVPDFRPSVTDWARAAFATRDVVHQARRTGGSLGIPTWFYGHEPPNAFAGQIAKYFRNAVREDTLLHHCRSGIVFLPGAAGTVQEVFQDACENYYATGRDVAPMVLVGTRYWTETVPVWPLLSRLAHGRAMADVVHLVDDVDDVLSRLRD